MRTFRVLSLTANRAISDAVLNVPETLPRFHCDRSMISGRCAYTPRSAIYSVPRLSLDYGAFFFHRFCQVKLDYTNNSLVRDAAIFHFPLPL